MEHNFLQNVLLKLNLLWFFATEKVLPTHLSVFLSGHLWPPKTRHPTNLNESVYMEKPVWQGDTSSDPKLSQHHPSPFGLWFQMGWNNSSQIGSVRQVGVKIDKKNWSDHPSSFLCKNAADHPFNASFSRWSFGNFGLDDDCLHLQAIDGSRLASDAGEEASELLQALKGCRVLPCDFVVPWGLCYLVIWGFE